MIKLSKNVRDGSVVVKHGDKYVLAGKRTKRPAGVYQAGRQTVLWTDTGRAQVLSPPGIAIAGFARALCK